MVKLPKMTKALAINKSLTSSTKKEGGIGIEPMLERLQLPTLPLGYPPKCGDNESRTRD